MKSKIVVSVAVLVTVLPLAAAAQAPPATGDLQIERKQRKAVVLPKPTAEQARSDADRAVDEIIGRDPHRVMDQTSPVRSPTRPDMNYDVKSGIQGDRLNKEMFKR